jgi:hypothetical protein
MLIVNKLISFATPFFQAIEGKKSIPKYYIYKAFNILARRRLSYFAKSQKPETLLIFTALTLFRWPSITLPYLWRSCRIAIR